MNSIQIHIYVLLDKETVTFSEVIKFLEAIVAEQHDKTEVACVYNVFDPDQTGHVSVIEIKEALRVWYGNRISEEEVQKILAFADLDNNGFVKEQGICAKRSSSFWTSSSSKVIGRSIFWRMEQHFPKFAEKMTTSRAIYKHIFENFLPGISFTVQSGILELSVDWLYFGNLTIFRFCQTSMYP